MINLKTTENSIKLLTKGKYCNDDINVTFEGGSGATIKTKGGWEGTQVPNNSFVENVYFNTSLSGEEVQNILSSLTYVETPLTQYPIYPLLCTTNGELVIFASDNGSSYVISYSTNIASGDYEFIFYDNNWYFNEYSVGKKVVSNYLGINSGLENNKLSSLFSTTPFVQSEGEEVKLSGEYDGSNIEVTEAGKIDIKALIEEKKIPLEIKVNVENIKVENNTLYLENAQVIGNVVYINKIENNTLYL